MTVETERINWLRTAGPVTQDNIRYQSFLNIKTDQNGNWFETFSIPFDTTCLGVGVNISFSGGVRNWVIGIRDLSRFGFGITLIDSTSGIGVAQTTLGLYYFATGQ